MHGVLHIRWSLYITCMSYPQRAEEGTRFPRTRVTHSCQPPCGCWKLDQGPLEEQAEAVSLGAGGVGTLHLCSCGLPSPTLGGDSAPAEVVSPGTGEVGTLRLCSCGAAFTHTGGGLCPGWRGLPGCRRGGAAFTHTRTPPSLCFVCGWCSIWGKRFFAEVSPGKVNTTVS